ncbi:hypothetical protein pfor_13c1706 [Rhodobacteraceae bacterium SB2]|jgi:hypothetical protein|nr:DUF3429 domain-containing protein [Marinovum sp.]MBT4230914.1 DUF3429 domain-containing protein [Paracoccaceae bacterium]OAH07822.1 hypothetical protein pfor_13c1706 [Rhodobacteraceae bacterium SB2]WQC64647.1 DUF3429 domain-containing protein [Alphaproteobacteria bacterium US3C007]MBT4954620.1 DUF3429 domain-containing protein [Paracoccaceae bacterium]|tara:strand:- start:1859 stop:2308 length:450 start_codon:yes stop_codon:yes gene_type:complete
MVNIPRSALVLGLAGVLPFFWGVATLYSDALSLWTLRTIGPRFNGPYVQVYYGAIILSFMSGVLWGFATKTSGRQATIGYILSVLPALWAFFMTGNGPTSASIHLMTGFAGLLLLDWFFWAQSLAPPWWMRLRVLLTALVLGCLGLGGL